MMYCINIDTKTLIFTLSMILLSLRYMNETRKFIRDNRNQLYSLFHTIWSVKSTKKRKKKSTIDITLQHKVKKTYSMSLILEMSSGWRSVNTLHCMDYLNDYSCRKISLSSSSSCSSLYSPRKHSHSFLYCAIWMIKNSMRSDQ